MGLFNKETEKFDSVSLNFGKKIKEGFKGTVLEDDKFKFNSELGEKHPFDANIPQQLYKDMGLVTAAVDKYIDFMIGPGIFPRSEDPRAVKILEDWMRDVSFDVHLREWFKEALIKFSGFMELGGDEDETVHGVKVLNAKRIFAEKNKGGEVTGYNQVQMDDNFVKFSTKDDAIHFEPFQIAHLNINKVSESAYGIGIIWSVRHTINSLLQNQKSLSTLMKRKANAPIWAKLGVAPNGTNPGQHASERAVEDFGNKMTVMQEKTEFSTDERVDLKVLDFGDLGAKFDFPINHDLDMFGTGVQIPDILMGRDVNMAVAPVQMDGFERRMKSIQASAENEIENKIFKRVLKANGMDVHVEVEWGQPSQASINARITQITELLKNPTLNIKLVNQLEKELAVLMGLNPEDVESDEEERRKEEEDLEQPLVPGQNRRKEHVHNNSCSHVNEDFSKDYTLREWLDFDFKNFLSDTVRFIEKDEFSLLLGDTEEKLKAGLLSNSEIGELKETLMDGFENGKTLREMSNELDKKISFKDRMQLDDDGEMVLKDGNPIVRVAAKNRSMGVIRSETTRVAAEGAASNYKRGGIKEYTWVASVGERTCNQCESLNGLTFSLEGSNPKPPQHSLCRCTIKPVVEGLE
jgi:SPP1 gp7 family putative phage head morphogenesis protein